MTDRSLAFLSGDGPTGRARTAALVGGLGLMLSACAPAAAPISAQAGAQAGAGAEVQCIDAARVVRRSPLGPDAVLFELSGGVAYRNRLPAACPGLARAEGFGRFLFEVNGGRLCRGDSFRVIDPSEARAVGAGAFPRCRLGGFTRTSAPR